MPGTPDIVVSAEAPFNVEVMVFEDDTWRLLSAGNQVLPIRAPLEALQQEVVHQQAHQRGDIIERGPRWYAILHDVDEEPGYRSADTETALELLVARLAASDVRSLGIQLLGAHHGPDDPQTALERLRACRWPDCISRIWIMADRAD